MMRLAVIAMLLGVIAAPAQSIEELLQLGMRALEAEDFKGAERMFSEVVKKAATAENIGYLAIAEAGNGKFAQAITHFQQAIRMGNNTAIMHQSLGLAYLSDHKPEPGIRELKLAVTLDPADTNANFALGAALLEHGRAREAVPYLQAASKKSPDNAEIWANLVHAQFEANSVKPALRTAESAIQALPESARLAVMLGEICIRYGQAQKARHYLENASTLEPDNQQFKLLLAKASLAAEEPIGALAVLNGIPQSAGKPGEIQLLTGKAKMLMGNYAEAETDLKAALQADPQNAAAIAAVAWLDQLKGRHDDALAALQKARDLNPRDPALAYQLAEVYFSLRKYEEAAQACESAIKLAPGYDPAYLLLGRTWVVRGKLDQAQTAIERAVSLRPDRALYHRELGMVLFKRGLAAKARKELDQAIALDPKAPQTYISRAELLATIGDRTKAIADLETAVALQPGSTDAYAALAPLYAAEGLSEKSAIVSARLKELKGAGQDSANFSAHVREAQAQLDGGHFAEALPHLEAAARLRPEDSPTLFNLGVAQLETGRTELAFQTLSGLAAREPSETATKSYLVRAAARLKNPEAVRTNLADLRKLAATDGPLHAQLAEWLFEDEGSEMAREQIEFALRLPLPPAQGARLHYLAGRLEHRRKEDTKAIQEFEKAIALNPDSVEALLELGLARYELGQFEEARRSLAEVIRVAPKLAMAYKMMAEVQRRLGKPDEADRYLERFKELGGR